MAKNVPTYLEAIDSLKAIHPLLHNMHIPSLWMQICTPTSNQMYVDIAAVQAWLLEFKDGLPKV
jgi:hypothetical protein